MKEITDSTLFRIGGWTCAGERIVGRIIIRSSLMYVDKSYKQARSFILCYFIWCVIRVIG